MDTVTHEADSIIQTDKLTEYQLNQFEEDMRNLIIIELNIYYDTDDLSDDDLQWTFISMTKYHMEFQLSWRDAGAVS